MTAHSDLDRARSLHARGAFEQAESAYRASLDREPGSVEARHGLGILLYQRGEAASGISLIVEAMDMRPDSASRCNDLGNIYAQIGELAKATAAFRRAVELEASDANLWNNLGSVLQRQQQNQAAESAFRRALECRDDFLPALTNLAALLGQSGRHEESSLLYCKAFVQPPLQGKSFKMLGIAYYRLGMTEQAAQCYRSWVAEEPDNAIALHQLAASSGENVPQRAPDGYVKTLFDDMADEFDEKLVSGLSYRGPAIIASLLAPRAARPRQLRVLDAGCGTGLCAPVLRPIAARLTGVDLSPAMLQKARARGSYDELVEAELTAFLQSHARQYDLIVMADTLIYFGGLGPLFAAVEAALCPSGHFAFTAELASGPAPRPEGYELTLSGRYAHERGLLLRELEACSLKALHVEEVVIRTEFCRPTEGLAVLAGAKP